VAVRLQRRLEKLGCSSVVLNEENAQVASGLVSAVLLGPALDTRRSQVERARRWLRE